MEQPRTFFDYGNKKVRVDTNNEESKEVFMTFKEFELWLLSMLQETRNAMGKSPWE